MYVYHTPIRFNFIYLDQSFNILFVFLAIVKSSKNIKRRVLWIKLNVSYLKKRWLTHQYNKGDIHYLPCIKHKNRVLFRNFTRKKKPKRLVKKTYFLRYSTRKPKSKYLINRIHSWRLLKIRRLKIKSALQSIPFLVC